MNIRSLKEMRDKILGEQEKYKNCEHDFDSKPVSFTTVGRFGGIAVNIYKCKKCGFESTNPDEIKEAESHYDDRGMPIDE